MTDSRKITIWYWLELYTTVQRVTQIFIQCFYNFSVVWLAVVSETFPLNEHYNLTNPKNDFSFLLLALILLCMFNEPNQAQSFWYVKLASMNTT